ncbi:hypothetical protein LTR78_007541 [Recurvomyces mirabilis]|uniref:Uncharacterized protein n=1 Tax=Recurvomyces mirabilis TaxID=574656 RepID=A0AAE0TVB6_9PEZI|nr:hypothetical protein LTR78_007541 [Recurvomyces mirabilis]KAK5159948.1 hypothetical protein LTS14_002054 [Recurvomyces mirabilis]
MLTPQTTPTHRRYGLNYYEDEYGVKDDDESFEHAGDNCEDDSEGDEEHNLYAMKPATQAAVGFFKSYARSLPKDQPESQTHAGSPAIDASSLTGAFATSLHASPHMTQSKLCDWDHSANGRYRGRGLFSNVTSRRNINSNISKSHQSASPFKHTFPQSKTPSKEFTPVKLGMFSTFAPSFVGGRPGSQAPPSTMQDSVEQSFVGNLGNLNDGFRTLEEDGGIPSNPYLAYDNIGSNEFEAYLRGEQVNEHPVNGDTSRPRFINEGLVQSEQELKDIPTNTTEDQGSVDAQVPGVETVARGDEAGPDDEGYQGDREEAQTRPEVKQRKKRAGLLTQIYGPPPKLPSNKDSKTVAGEPLGRTRAATTKAIEEQKRKRPNTRSGGAVVVIKQIRSSKRNKATARAATLRKTAKKVDAHTPRRVSKMSVASGTRKSASTGGLRNWKGEKLELGPGQGIVVIRRE